MIQALSAVNNGQTKASTMMMTRNAPALAFGAKQPNATSARGANNSNSVTVIALIALGVAAAAAAVWGLVSYFRKGRKADDE